jgi:hypothetical protein
MKAQRSFPVRGRAGISKLKSSYFPLLGLSLGVQRDGDDMMEEGVLVHSFWTY